MVFPGFSHTKNELRINDAFYIIFQDPMIILFSFQLSIFFLGKIVPFYLKEHTPTTKRLFVISKNFKKMMAKKNARKNE